MKTYIVVNPFGGWVGDPFRAESESDARGIFVFRATGKEANDSRGIFRLKSFGGNTVSKIEKW